MSNVTDTRARRKSMHFQKDEAPEGKCWTYGKGVVGFLSRAKAEKQLKSRVEKTPIRLENRSQVVVIFEEIPFS